MFLKFEFHKHLTKFCVSLFAVMFVFNILITAYQYRTEFSEDARLQREARDSMLTLYHSNEAEYRRLYEEHQMKYSEYRALSANSANKVRPVFQNEYIDVEGYGDIALFNDIEAIINADGEYHAAVNTILHTSALRALELDGTDNYLYRYYNDLLAAYDPLTELEIPASEVRGWNEFFSLKTPIVFIVIVTLAMFCSVFTLDSNVGMTAIQHTARKGNKPVILAKLGYTAIMSCAVTVIITLSPLIVFAVSTGLSGLDTPLQRLDLFTLSSSKFTVGQYLWVFTAIRVVVFLAVALAVAVIGQYTRIEAPAVILITVLAGIGAGFAAIPVESKFYFLQKFSLTLIADVNILFERFRGLNFFNYCVNYTVFIPTVLIFICVLLFAVSMLYKQRTVVSTKQESKAQMLTMESLSLLRTEGYKHLVSNSGALVILAAVILKCIISGYYYAPVIDSNEAAYMEYIEHVAGEVTDEKIEYIDAEAKYIKNTMAEHSDIQDKYREGGISKEEYDAHMERYNYAIYYRFACERLVELKDYLLAQKEKGYDVEFLYEEGINRYLNPPLDIALILCAMFVCSGIFAMEHETGFAQIMRLTRKGRRAIFRVKICFVLIVAAVVSVLFAAIDTAYMLTNYGVDYWSADIHSMPVLAELPFEMSIGVYTLIYRLISVLGCILVFVLVTALSDIMKSRLKAIIAAAGIIFIPFMLGTYEVDILHVISAADFMAPTDIVYAVPTVVVFTAASVISLFVSRRRWIGKGEKK